MKTICESDKAELDRYVAWFAENTQDWLYLPKLGPIYLARPQPGEPYHIVWYNAVRHRVSTVNPFMIDSDQVPGFLGATQWAALLLAAINF